VDSASLLSMFLLGLLGSGHCLGMCGPLVVAIPAQAGGLASHLLYHSGRVLTYVALGALLGELGSGFATLRGGAAGPELVGVARVQLVFSLLAAASLALLGLVRLGLLREPVVMQAASPERVPGFSSVLARATRGRSRAAVFAAGLLLGLLPCGLSYGAFAMALAAGGGLAGGLWLLVFGLGTAPALLVLGVGASGFFRRHRRLSDLLAGMLMVGMAAALLGDLVAFV
jgi:sulfite exporter TauE/SafE